jgi:hypothetical protein
MRNRSFGGGAQARAVPRVGAFLTGLALVLWPLAPPGAQAQPPPAKPPATKLLDRSPASCTQVIASTISEAFGYKHVVTLRNSCDKAVECEVWTDVDPTPRHVLRANKGEGAEVITRIGSPASVFKAFKECRFR